jgi:hypothetical protein
MDVLSQARSPGDYCCFELPKTFPDGSLQFTLWLVIVEMQVTPNISRWDALAALDNLSDQLGLSRDGFAEYDLRDRNGQRYWAKNRSPLGLRPATLDDAEGLMRYLW